MRKQVEQTGRCQIMKNDMMWQVLLLLVAEDFLDFLVFMPDDELDDERDRILFLFFRLSAAVSLTFLGSCR